jgi:hypothetical protein
MQIFAADGEDLAPIPVRDACGGKMTAKNSFDNCSVDGQNPYNSSSFAHDQLM